MIQVLWRKVNRFLVADDLTPDQSWQLLRFCQARGATELTVVQLSLQGGPTTFIDRFAADMAGHARAHQLRPHLSGTSLEDFTRMTALWTLDDASVDVLHRYFTDGLFMYPAGTWDVGCLEDPIFYREGEIMFGIVTHEREGMLSLTDVEHGEVAALGIRTRDEPEWL